MAQRPDDQIEFALRHTELVRPPQQRLSTFGVTNVHYYLLTEPMESVNETRIREGRVIAEKPRIVTPGYFMNALEGFGENARAQAIELFSRYGFDPDILEYKYRNEAGNSWTLSEEIGQVALKIGSKIDDEKDLMATILKGPDDGWQISLMKFIFDLTRVSLHRNVAEMQSMGLFDRIGGVPRFVREEIEGLFRAAEDGHLSLKELGSRLQSYGLFEHYEDRFFALFNRKR
ncbi:MAG: hypothetical protein FJZ95_09240 [Chloroflexi bacterium]|nr:hypothetical protein [Chloroflexota bacterium]